MTEGSAGPSSTARMIAGAMVLADREGWTPSIAPEEAAWCRRLLQSADARLLLFSAKWGPGRLFWRALELALAPGLILHFLRRKAWLAEQCDHLLAGPEPQLVVLGAGLDGLSLRLAELEPNLRVIECDRPAVTRIRHDAAGERSNLRIVAGDLAEIGQNGRTLERLREQIAPDRPTVFCCEGVIMYMPREEVEQMLRVLGSLTERASFLLTCMDKPFGQPVGFRPYRRLVRWWLNRQGEPFLWGANKSEIDGMLSETGWRTVSVVDEHELARRWAGRCLEGELLIHAEKASDTAPPSA